jgi:hypothetical protein
MARKQPSSSKPPAGSAARAREKAAAFRAAERRRQRRRRMVGLIGAVVAVIVVAVVITVAVLNSGSGSTHKAGGSASSGASAPASQLGPEGIALEQGSLLAPATGAATGQPVDGVQCNSMEQAAFHIHTHLSVYVDGALRPVPAGVGAVTPVPQQTANGTFDNASRCFYWLHTHAQDGIIHVEAPNHATYTLGQFFAIWRQPLTGNQVGPARGSVTAYVDGRRYTGDPAKITLASHEDVQLDVGTPVVPPGSVDWSRSEL